MNNRQNTRPAVCGNPFMAPWERIPDGEPRVFTDPDTGRPRMYVYGSHDTRACTFCGPDHVVWSAPVEDLTDWRHDGTAIHINQLEGLPVPAADGTLMPFRVGGEVLYAPDVVYHPQLETYFMFVFTSGSHRIFVAESKRPAGPFVNPRYVCQGFDPAVLVDDEKDENGNQRVYLYWSVESERSAWACEWNPVTNELVDGTLHVPVGHGTAANGNDTMPHRHLAPFYFFEGPSIRKIGGLYVLSYAKTDDKPGNGSLAEIGFCYSDNPYGDPRLGTPWQFGGTIIDNRGETVRDPYTGEPTFTYKGGNNHGGMAEVNGQWYQIYHRWTGIGMARQAMAAAIYPRVEDGKLIIEQAEVMSEGFRVQGLDPYEEHYAVSACFGLGSYVFDVNPAEDFTPGSERDDRYPVRDVRNGTWLGYKYFDFADGAGEGEQTVLHLMLKDCAPGTVRVWASEPKQSFTDPEQPRTHIGTGALDGTGVCRVLAIPVTPLRGRKAIYLEFLSDAEGTVCEPERFRFTVGTN